MMAMIQGISGRGTVIQGKFITGQPAFAPLSPPAKAIQPQMITMQPSPQILGAPQHRPPKMIQQQPALPQQFGTPKRGQPSTVQRHATPITVASPRPAPPLGQPNAIQRQSLQPTNTPSAVTRQYQHAPLLGQPINAGTVQPSRGPIGHIVVQRVGNGEVFQLPEHLSKFGSSGKPLPSPVLQKMESCFKTSFSDVRVHVGPEPATIGALAFTHGSNLYFAPGQYNPNTAKGQQLLGHELMHVVQQRSYRARNPFSCGIAVVRDGLMEAEADRMGLLASAHRDSLNAACKSSVHGISEKTFAVAGAHFHPLGTTKKGLTRDDSLQVQMYPMSNREMREAGFRNMGNNRWQYDQDGYHVSAIRENGQVVRFHVVGRWRGGNCNRLDYDEADGNVWNETEIRLDLPEYAAEMRAIARATAPFFGGRVA